jgi:hypothetical protein
VENGIMADKHRTIEQILCDHKPHKVDTYVEGTDGEKVALRVEGILASCEIDARMAPTESMLGRIATSRGHDLGVILKKIDGDMTVTTVSGIYSFDTDKPTVPHLKSVK